VIHVHDRITVNPLELLFTKAFLQRAQRLSREDSLVRSHDPYQFSFRPKSEDVVRIQEEILSTIPSNDLSTGNRIRRNRGDRYLCDLVGDIKGVFMEKPFKRVSLTGFSR